MNLTTIELFKVVLFIIALITLIICVIIDGTIKPHNSTESQEHQLKVKKKLFICGFISGITMIILLLTTYF